MFERFTDRARRVVVLAQEHARLRCHHHIDETHILMGLIDEGEGVAAQVLKDLRLSLNDIDPGATDGPTPSGHLEFTPSTKKLMELSLREALQLGHNYIGTEHILLALVRAGSVEHLLPVPGHEVRAAVIQKLLGYSSIPSPLDEARRSSDRYIELIEVLREAKVLADGLEAPIGEHIHVAVCEAERAAGSALLSERLAEVAE